MTREAKRIDVSQTPELLRIAEEVHRSDEPRVLTRADEELAVVMPARKHRAQRRAKGASPNQWLENLIGIASSGGPGDISANKHKYLADAYSAGFDNPAKP